MEAFTAPRAASTLDELFERPFEVVLMAPSRASILEEELESERLEVWFVEIRPLVAARAASVLTEELESMTLEVWLVVMLELVRAIAPSTLEDC
jgi:hypothetical protein